MNVKFGKHLIFQNSTGTSAVSLCCFCGFEFWFLYFSRHLHRFEVLGSEWKKKDKRQWGKLTLEREKLPFCSWSPTTSHPLNLAVQCKLLEVKIEEDRFHGFVLLFLCFCSSQEGEIYIRQQRVDGNNSTNLERALFESLENCVVFTQK